jgi:hypothetical protein
MVEYDNPIDCEELHAHRSAFETDIASWCLDHGFGFFGTYDQITPSRSDKIVKATVVELMYDQSELAVLNTVMGESGKHLFYLTDNLLNHSKLHQFEHITFVSIPELLGIMSLSTIQPNTSPSRLYNCFIQRVDSVRQSWFYLLHHHNLLDRGYVTFLLFQYDWYSSKTGVELYDWIHTQYDLDKLLHFDTAYHLLRPLVPFRNFDPAADLRTVASDCKYSLVLETYAAEDDSAAFCFTEKTHRALQTPSINLIFAQQNSLAYLVHLGFEIADCMLEIDCYPWIVRQQKILDILINDDLEFDAKLLYDQAMHNQGLFANYKHQFLQGHFVEKIFSEIVKK